MNTPEVAILIHALLARASRCEWRTVCTQSVSIRGAGGRAGLGRREVPQPSAEVGRCGSSVLLVQHYSGSTLHGYTLPWPAWPQPAGFVVVAEGLHIESFARRHSSVLEQSADVPCPRVFGFLRSELRIYSHRRDVQPVWVLRCAPGLCEYQNHSYSSFVTRGLRGM